MYYARAVNPTMLPALNEISTQQAKPTEQAINKCNHLLDYAATYPNAVIRYHASNMALQAMSTLMLHIWSYRMKKAALLATTS